VQGGPSGEAVVPLGNQPDVFTIAVDTEPQEGHSVAIGAPTIPQTQRNNILTSC
jgi:hypothetical protein